jgi:hypothetical protein
MSGSDKEEQIPDNLKLATIALLTNVNCRARLETLDSVNDIRRRQRQQMRRDIRFYRKRISAVIKDLLMRRNNPIASERVQCAFDELVRVVIDELRIADTSDIIQTELQADDSDSNHDNDCAHEEENETSGQNSSHLARNTDKVITYANELLTATKTAPATMDRFVIKKTIDEPEIKSLHKRHEQIRNKAPISKVDLREPTLRTKGIPAKKENVNSSYEKTDGQAEQAKPQTDAKEPKRRRKKKATGNEENVKGSK